MKKSWLLLFLLIIMISIGGCSTTPNSTSSSSTTPIPTTSEYNEIAHSNFCIGWEKFTPYVTFDPPLVLDQSSPASRTVFMPVDPGKYKITVTTSTPDANVRVFVAYKPFEGTDKFGNSQYPVGDVVTAGGTSDKNADYNKEASIPDDSINGTIWISDNQFGDTSHNCGTLIVTRIK